MMQLWEIWGESRSSVGKEQKREMLEDLRANNMYLQEDTMHLKEKV
jgi:hypothetical protein